MERLGVLRVCRTQPEAVNAATAEAAAWLAEGYTLGQLWVRLNAATGDCDTPLVGPERVRGGASFLAYARRPTLFACSPFDDITAGVTPELVLWANTASVGGGVGVPEDLALQKAREPFYEVLSTSYAPEGMVNVNPLATAPLHVRVLCWVPRWVALQLGAGLTTPDVRYGHRARWEAWAEAWWAEAAFVYPMTVAILLAETVRRVKPQYWPRVTLKRAQAWSRWQSQPSRVTYKNMLKELVQEPTVWACL